MNILIENSVLLSHEGPVVFKPFLYDISWYNYIHKDYIISDKTVGKLFRQFKGHPLIIWKLEVVYGGNTHILELITNITHGKKGFGAFTVSDVHYANDPCMIYQNNEFLGSFNKDYSRGNSFDRERLYVDIYRSQLISKLNSSIFDHGIFYQRDLSGSVGYGVKIDLLGPKM